MTGISEDYLDNHGRYDFVVRNMEQKWILGFLQPRKLQ